MEIARRMADSGKRTGLVCFNKLVGEWVATNVSKDVGRPNLLAGPAIRMLMDMTGVTIPASPDEVFWESGIYDAIEEKLTDPEFNDDLAFDYLIIDEAQDVLSKPRLFQALMQLVPGGVEEGSYCLVGDFKYQLFGNRADLENILAEVRAKAKGIPTYPLYENCRNYSIVGGSAVKLSGIKDKVYEGFMRSGGSMTNFNLNFYADRPSQLNLLAEVIRKSKTLGYDDADIIVLSLVNDDQCVARDLQKLSFKVSPAKQPQPNTVRYCTINSFKGLEAKVVIVTDIEAEENEFKRNQLYTSLTRATESVHVLFSESSRNLVAKWIF
jgi:superfamily I DNA/RNA helicase